MCHGHSCEVFVTAMLRLCYGTNRSTKPATGLLSDQAVKHWRARWRYCHGTSRPGDRCPRRIWRKGVGCFKARGRVCPVEHEVISKLREVQAWRAANEIADEFEVEADVGRARGFL